MFLSHNKITSSYVRDYRVANIIDVKFSTFIINNAIKGILIMTTSFNNFPYEMIIL